MTRGIESLLLILLSLTAIQAQKLVIFGDSLSDTGARPVGGGYTRWLQSILRDPEAVWPQAPYADGVWTNGLVWPQYVSQTLGIDFVNWAAGGASTGAGILQPDEIPGSFLDVSLSSVQIVAPNLAVQLDQNYLSSNNTANGQDTYMIWIGNNDYFSLANGDANVTAQRVVGYIFEAFEDLYDHGARKFIVATIPPLAALPSEYLSDEAFSTQWGAHNDLIAENVQQFNTSHPDAKMQIFDFSSLVLEVAVKAQSYGFSNALQHCLNASSTVESVEENEQPCEQPDQHLFWDQVHPTTAAHKFIATAFSSQFESYLGAVRLPSLGPSGTSPAAAPAASNRRLKFFEYVN